MAKRLSPKHDEMTRQKIQTSQLINRLMKIGLGDDDCTPTQMKAIEILLRKSLPDLSAVTVGGDADNPLAVTEIRRVIVDPNGGA